MNKGVPEGTLRIEISGSPASQQELLDLQGAVNTIFWPSDADTMLDRQPGEAWVGQFQRQPYEQGGDLVEIELRRDYQSEWHAEFYEGVDPADEPDYHELWGYHSEAVGTARFTGWVFTDWYTDSMTNIYESPVFHDEEMGYFLWPM